MLVLQTDNVPRVRDGYISLGTRGHPRKWELRAAAVEVTDGEQLAWALEPAAPHTEASLHDDVTDER